MKQKQMLTMSLLRIECDSVGGSLCMDVYVVNVAHNF